MNKTVVMRQTVTRGINYTTWTIPGIRDGNRSSASPGDNNFFPPAETFRTILSQVLIQSLRHSHLFVYQASHYPAHSGDYLKGKLMIEMVNIC